jgi:hypothetical protein
MDRTDLAAALDQLGVDPRADRLGSGSRDERYCLEDQRSAWSVYYSERGLRTRERLFASDHLLDLRSRVRLHHTLVDQRGERQQRIRAVLYDHGLPHRPELHLLTALCGLPRT